MGNEVRVKPKKSKESPYKCTTFGIELESRRSLCDLKWPPVMFTKVTIYYKDLIWEKIHKIPGNVVTEYPNRLLERGRNSAVFEA